MLNWLDCFGALAIVWIFLVMILAGEWIYQTYQYIKKG